MYKLRCRLCGNGFSSQQSNTLVCSDICRKKRNNEKSGRMSYQNKLPTATVGAISEMAIALDLMSKGYAVFRAISASSKVDLLVTKRKQTLSIECRTGYLNESGNVFYPKRKDDEADVYAAYVSKYNKTYYFYPDHKTPFPICEELS